MPDFPKVLSFAISIGGQDGGTHELAQDTVTIGKGGAATLQLDDSALADLHCAVHLGDDGEYVLLDLGSPAGTLLNGQPINNGPIKHGDEIRVGNAKIKVGVTERRPVAAATAQGGAGGDSPRLAGVSGGPAAALSAAEQVGRGTTVDLTLADPHDVINQIVWSSGDHGGGVGAPKSTKVLQVAQVWFNQVMNVGHFGADVPLIHLGDKIPHGLRIFSSSLVVLMMVAAGFFAWQANAIVPPELLPPGDADLMKQWRTEADELRVRLGREQYEKDQAEQAALQAEADERKVTIEEIKAERKKAKAEADEKLPKDPLEARETAFNEEAQKAYDRAVAREPNRFWQLPPFGLYQQPTYETILRESLMPWAREKAAIGELDKFWVDALKGWTKTYDVYADLEIPRTAEDLPWGTRILKDGAVLMVVPGIDPDQVHLADASDKISTVAPSDELTLWAPSEQEVLDRTAVYHEVQTLLLAQAKARRSHAAMCDVLARLLEFPDEKEKFETNAVYGPCLTEEGRWDAARSHLAAAMDKLPTGELTEDQTFQVLAVLQAQAMLLMRDGWGGDPMLEDPAVVPPEKASAARAAVTQLRQFLLDRAKDPQALAKADALLHRIELQKTREEHAGIIRRAMMSSALLLLLLPFGIGIDQLRLRGSAPDFYVPAGSVPNNHFPIVDQVGGLKLNFTKDWVGFVDRKGQRTALKDLAAAGLARDAGAFMQADLSDDDAAFVDIGNIHFVVGKVHSSKVVPTPYRSGVDWYFLSILGFFLLIGGLLAIRMLLIPFEPRQTSAEVPDRFVELFIQPVEKQKEKTGGNPDAGEGAKAKKEEGKVGKKEAKLKKAKGAKVAVNKAQLDRQIAESAGLLSALSALDSPIMGGAGLSGDVTNAVGGLIGAHGTQYGSGGLGSRGSGYGGGGTAEGIGGLGTKGRGTGATGYGRGGGYYGQKGAGGPGMQSGEPIILGALDKSIIDRIVKQNLAQIKYCYEKELNKNQNLFGKLVIKFIIAKDGSVSSATTKATTLNNPIVEGCVNARFLRMRFPAPKGGGIVVVSYPFVFNSSSGGGG